MTAIPGCQRDYMRNEPQSRNGDHTCDPDLEVGRHRLLTRILTQDDIGFFFFFFFFNLDKDEVGRP